MDNQGFRVGQWNAGSNIENYKLLFNDNLHNSSASDYDHKEINTLIGNVRDKLLKETTKDLIHKADVFTLQQVGGNDRPDIQVLMENGFQIIRPDTSKQDKTNTDTAIAIDPKKFKDIENRSIRNFIGESFAVAVATEKSSGKKVAFVSGHIAGFNLEDRENMSTAAHAGDNEVKTLLRKLNQLCTDCDTIIIGADMNASPEIYNERFKLMADAGFSLHRTHGPTQRMSEQRAPTQERELDYIFVRNQQPQTGFMNFLKNLFNKPKGHVGKIVIEKNSLTLDPIFTPSDHLPVFLTVKESKSPLNRLVNNVKKYFGMDKKAKELTALENDINKYNYTKLNAVQSSLINTGFFNSNTQPFTHNDETLHALKDLSKKLDNFEADYLRNSDLSARRAEMLERLKNLREIIKTESSTLE